MKDLHISAKRQKSELKWSAGCFCVAILLNILSIIMYKTLWSEIFTQLLWVLIITCALYVVSVFVRVIFYFIKKLF
jgi:hypothetical protein